MKKCPANKHISVVKHDGVICWLLITPKGEKEFYNKKYFTLDEIRHKRNLMYKKPMLKCDECRYFIGLYCEALKMQFENGFQANRTAKVCKKFKKKI